MARRARERAARERATRVARGTAAILASLLLAPASGTPAPEAPLWNGEESVADYARRVQLEPARTLDLGGGVLLEMVLVPAGRFVMGSPDSEPKTDEHVGKETQHSVTLTRPFYMSRYETTQEQYQQLTGTNPSGVKGPRYPVTDVSWEDAVAAARRASDVLGQEIRLPTDAEWEHAARAGTSTTVYTGDDLAAVHAAGWCGGNERRLHLVGEKPPNRFGLHDMIGNVREWTRDVYAAYPAGAVVDPAGPASGEMRISRGGAYTGQILVCRAAIRNVEPPTKKNGIIGLRLVMTVPSARAR